MDELFPELIRIVSFFVMDRVLNIQDPVDRDLYPIQSDEVLMKPYWDVSTQDAYQDILAFCCRRLEPLSHINRHWRRYVSWNAIANAAQNAIAICPNMRPKGFTFVGYRGQCARLARYHWGALNYNHTDIRMFTLRFVFGTNEQKRKRCPFNKELCRRRARAVRRAKDGSLPSFFLTNEPAGDDACFI